MELMILHLMLWIRQLIGLMKLFHKESNHTKFLILHTRWKNMDLIGYFKEVAPEEFIFLEYPAVNKDWTKVLWPERYSLDFFVKKKKIIGEAMFQAVYQQRPLDLSTDFFNMNMLNWVSPDGQGSPITSFNPIVMQCRSWDLGIKSGKKNDYTRGIPVYRLKQGDILLTDHVYSKFGEITDKKEGKINTTNILKRVAKVDSPKMVQCYEISGPSRDLVFEEIKRQIQGYRLHNSDHKNMPKEDRTYPFKKK